MAVSSLFASHEIDSVHLSKSFLSFHHCEAQQCMLSHCAKQLFKQQLTLLLLLIPAHSTETGLSQMKPSISMIDFEAPQIINLLKCFLLTNKSSYWSSRLI